MKLKRLITSHLKALATIVALAPILSFALPSESTGPRQRTLGRLCSEFEAVDVASGDVWKLSEQTSKASATVLYFNSTQCPVTNRYLPTLNKLTSEFADKNVVFVTVNSNQHDSSTDIRTHAVDYGLNFPALQDVDGSIARSLSVSRTAEAIVLDSELKIRYRGVVDDRFERGVTRPRVKRRFLANAIHAVLKNRMVATAITDVEACPLNLAASKTAGKPHQAVNYSEHIAPILQQRCQSCHRPGGVGPFSLMNFNDARSWSTSIREVVTQGLMPPWHADAPHGHFANDRSLTEHEYEALLNWIDDGTAEGNPANLPAPKVFPDEWTIGTPDQVITMEKSITVPAETPRLGVPYKYVWGGEPFAKETWVKAAEVRPGASEVVHHVIAYIVPEGTKLKLVNDERRSGWLSEIFSPLPDMDYLVAFVPGDNAFAFPDGLAKRVPKGSRILFEMHYTPTGRKAIDQTKLGLIFADKPPRHEVLSGGTYNYWFSIPPGAPNHEVKASTEKFRRDSVLLSMNPHMHYRGKSYRYDLIEPSGKRTLLLNVPNYNFEWQSTYWLAEPINIPQGSYIECTAVFDNSEDNPFNPGPTVRVEWGEQTWQEMMLAGLEYYEKQPITNLSQLE